MPCINVTLVLSRKPARRILHAEDQQSINMKRRRPWCRRLQSPSPNKNAPVLENVHNLLRCSSALDWHIGLGEDGIAALKLLDHLPGQWRMLSRVVAGDAWGGSKGKIKRRLGGAVCVSDLTDAGVRCPYIPTVLAKSLRETLDLVPLQLHAHRHEKVFVGVLGWKNSIRGKKSTGEIRAVASSRPPFPSPLAYLCSTGSDYEIFVGLKVCSSIANPFHALWHQAHHVAHRLFHLLLATAHQSPQRLGLL